MRINMSKSLFIAEKPSVAKEFARVLKLNARQGDGYLEAQNTIVTWCVGHLVTMSYPEVYDEALKKWSLNTLPFFPENDVYKYEVIPAVKKQFQIVSELLNREDVATIYVCTDSGREGEYIYRLVDQMAKVPDTKKKLRVWIDSQTEEEIIRGIKEAKPISEYDTVAASAYLRAKEQEEDRQASILANAGDDAPIASNAELKNKVEQIKQHNELQNQAKALKQQLTARNKHYGWMAVTGICVIVYASLFLFDYIKTGLPLSEAIINSLFYGTIINVLVCLLCINRLVAKLLEFVNIKRWKHSHPNDSRNRFL